MNDYLRKQCIQCSQAVTPTHFCRALLGKFSYWDFPHMHIGLLRSFVYRPSGFHSCIKCLLMMTIILIRRIVTIESAHLRSHRPFYHVAHRTRQSESTCRCYVLPVGLAQRVRRYFGYSWGVVLKFFVPLGRHVAPMGRNLARRSQHSRSLLVVCRIWKLSMWRWLSRFSFILQKFLFSV